MKKLLATMCAFALVIPCVIGLAACKKEGPIKVSGKTFAYDHVEIKFDSDEAKETELDGKTEKEYIEEYSESMKLIAYKYTKTEMLLGFKFSAEKKEYIFHDLYYYKQSKEKLMLYKDAEFKTAEDMEKKGLKVYTTPKYLVEEKYEKGVTTITYFKAI